MLPLKFRLKKERDFKRVYRRGRRKGGFFFAVSYLNNFSGTRFGIVASAKAIKKAVKRNLAKRMVRGLLWRHQTLWPKNLDVIINIKQEIKEKKQAEAELKRMLEIIKNGR